MDEEMKSFQENNAWKLVDLPKAKTVVENKWPFKIKRNENTEVDRYKARLGAKGFSQQKGVDYDEIFSPVARFSSLRMLLALAVKYDLDVDHLDVKTAFLNGELQEEIFMSQPEGCVKKGNETKVCLLNKVVYGLKQSAHAWNQRLRNVLVELGLNQSRYEPCVYFLIHEDVIIIIAVYVDDLFVCFFSAIRQ
jgi:hypothetical protein